MIYKHWQKHKTILPPGGHFHPWRASVKQIDKKNRNTKGKHKVQTNKQTNK